MEAFQGLDVEQLLKGIPLMLRLSVVWDVFALRSAGKGAATYSTRKYKYQPPHTSWAMKTDREICTGGIQLSCFCFLAQGQTLRIFFLKCNTQIFLHFELAGKQTYN